MSEELERAAACVVLPGFPGTTLPDWMRRGLARGVGGAVLFGWNTESSEQTAELTDAIRAEQPDALIAADEEGGDVTRLEAIRGSSYPGALALGVVDDLEATRAVASALASELARAGIGMNFAPVADVNTNPRNPVIGVRAFGSDPELVARHVVAFIEGTHRCGIAACVKHFPGHGDTSVDSHLDLPRVDGPLDAALVPFRAAVAAGVDAMMTAHIVAATVDADAPATLSARVLGLLREELAFDGLVITDALEMGAISRRFGFGDAAVRSLAAGADALCLGHDSDEQDVDEVVAAIVAAVRDGRLAEERLADAARRSESATRRTLLPQEPDGVVPADVARRALRTSGAPRVDGQPTVVELAPPPNMAAGKAGFSFGDAARAAWPGVELVRLREGEEVPDPRTRPIVVVRDALVHPWQQQVVERLLAGHPDAVVVETGVPGWRPDGAVAFVTTHGAGRVSLQAAVELLAGA